MNRIYSAARHKAAVVVAEEELEAELEGPEVEAGEEVKEEAAPEPEVEESAPVQTLADVLALYLREMDERSLYSNAEEMKEARQVWELREELWRMVEALPFIKGEVTEALVKAVLRQMQSWGDQYRRRKLSAWALRSVSARTTLNWTWWPFMRKYARIMRASFSRPSSSATRAGESFMFSSAPPVFKWSILAADLKTAVGPSRSAPWTGEMPSDTGSPALRPSGMAPVTEPK